MSKTDKNNGDLIEKLCENRDLTDGELNALLETDEWDETLFHAADAARRDVYGTDVYIRGLIELTNHCKNNCYYCGIRQGNGKIKRYRLSMEEVLACCDEGYRLGFRTFVLQGGEDPFDTDERLCGLVAAIKARHSGCAVTLSLGERPYASCKALFGAGADRYLLRHETASAEHYRQLHPPGMSLESRVECLWNLKEIGFQVGSGFMAGSPYQTTAHIVKDIRFLQALQPAMIGVGPYLTQRDTPFRGFANGSLQLTLRLVALLRLMFPHALIPATTALGTIAEGGREMGLLAGANVVMPNLSPAAVRKLYAIYDDKASWGEEAAECKADLERRVASLGYRVVVHRGDAKTGAPPAEQARFK